MQEQPPSPDLIRRKQVRIRFRPDLRVERQSLDGKAAYFIKNPIGLHYHYFHEREYFLIRNLDGEQTLTEIREKFEATFRPDRLQEADLEGFAQHLVRLGLACPDNPGLGKVIYERRKKREMKEWFGRVTNILFIKLPLFDPDRLLGHMVPYTRWIFTGGFLVLSGVAMLAALLFVGMHLTAFRARMPDAQAFFSFDMAVALWVAIGLLKILHEFGHGLACKSQGGEVHAMGVLLLCFSPSLYCDVSDAWALAGKLKRMLVIFAGIYVELLVAVLATVFWWNAPGATFLNRLCLALMVVASVSTVMFNANPLLRFDGYYFVAAWLEIPDLRERANLYLRRLALEWCLGIEPSPEPMPSLRRRLMFAAYAIISFVYGWFITFGILWFLYRFLKPYKLGTVGALIAFAAACLMVGRPLYSLGQFLHKRGWTFPEMKPKRVKITTSVVVVLLLAFFFLPLPVSRVRETALVQVRPEALQKVFVIVPGTLVKLHVWDGQRVETGDVLAEFESLELERQLEDARSEHDIRMVHARVLKEQVGTETDPVRKAKLRVEIASVEGERQAFAGQAKVLESQKQRLVLRAPCAGVVMSPPKKDEVGKAFEKDQGTPFCTVGDPSQLQALVPVTPADHRILREDLDNRGVLHATIRVRGRESDAWEGQVGVLPQAEAKEVPLALTNRCGGPLAAKGGQGGAAAIPQDQHYLVAVDFDADSAVACGVLGQVKIYTKWRSGAWWMWRAVSQTFELGV